MGQDRMIKSSGLMMSRRGLLGAFAASTVVAAPHMANAFSLLRGAGDIRRLKMYNGRSGEHLDVIYWIEGDYIDESLSAINHFFRDLRAEQSHRIDTRTIDFIAATHNMLESDEPYTLLSGYRSPQTNAALRRNSRGVARNSRHMVGQAADLRLRSRSVSQVSRAAVACSAGGVGRYSRSNFTHVDCGPVRTWGA